jgi:NADH:ubiquinone oxidoreductase subunit 2 (subunit N)
MNTPPTNQAQRVEVRLRTLRILWLALFLSVGIYYVFTLFAERPPDLKPNNTLSLALIGVAVTTVLFSFLVKRKLLARAINEQQLQLVQPAYVMALALCEVPALLGMLEFFTTANPKYYVLMIIAALGQLLHFPKREHVENAAFKR